MIESKKGAADILKLAKTVTLREGFDSTSDLCESFPGSIRFTIADVQMQFSLAPL